jgi:hypothetical protein
MGPMRELDGINIGFSEFEEIVLDEMTNSNKNTELVPR